MRVSSATLSSTLMTAWLEATGDAWPFSVWVPRVSDLAPAERVALRFATMETIVFGIRLVPERFIYICGVVSRVRMHMPIRPEFSRRLGGLWDRELCLRHWVTGRRAHFRWTSFREYMFIGATSEHPPLCMECLEAGYTSGPCCQSCHGRTPEVRPH